MTAQFHLEAIPLAGCLALAALAMPGTTIAADQTINFEGSVITATCTFTAPNTVPLPKAMKSDLTGAVGKRGAGTSFTINVTNCNDGATPTPAVVDGKMKALFKIDDKVDLNTGMLKNVATGGKVADGVQLRLRNADNDSPIMVGDANTVHAFTLDTAGAANLIYKVEYESSEATVTDGAVRGTVALDIAYE
ncbi:fimbrial protein [Dyella flagellata]|uniref:Major type 1 subunit fimbrin (Pilin) n=1 Tax=Dyella flagellata TaxID=1867833 RepID=A0ABQ5X7E6_9GAMM|nr:fimbrial protein [Dyella flagellata]GLQ87547.1 hypothetical protein GCM10007898_11130 [Dyella flagellata]